MFEINCTLIDFKLVLMSNKWKKTRHRKANLKKKNNNKKKTKKKQSTKDVDKDTKNTEGN